MSNSQTSLPDPNPTPNVSNRSEQSSALATIGGGLLALGIILTVVPGFIDSATSTNTSIWEVLKTAGQIILGFSALVLIAALVRSITHAGRHSAVR